MDILPAINKRCNATKWYPGGFADGSKSHPIVFHGAQFLNILARILCVKVLRANDLWRRNPTTSRHHVGSVCLNVPGIKMLWVRAHAIIAMMTNQCAIGYVAFKQHIRPTVSQRRAIWPINGRAQNGVSGFVDLPGPSPTSGFRSHNEFVKPFKRGVSLAHAHKIPCFIRGCNL